MKLRAAACSLAALTGLLSLPDAALGQVRILSVAPATVQPGNTLVMTGSGFPAGVSAANVKIQFAPVAAGAGPTVTVPLASLTTLAGTTLRVTVLVPASLLVTAPTPYQTTLSATVAPTFTTAVPGKITVDPPPTLLSATPQSGNPGQTINVIVAGSFTNFFQGISTASFGPGIAVNSVNVTNPTSLTATVIIAAGATPAVNNVVVTTGAEVDTLKGGFAIIGAPVVISSLNILPSSIPLGIATSVTATAVITGSPASGSVQLQRLDSSGRVIATVGTMNPVANSANFSLTTNFTEFAVGPVSLQVTATAVGATSHVFSPVATLTVTGTPPPTITITAPTSLSFLNLSPTTVNGSVSDPTAGVAINSVAAAVAPNGNFSAQIPLAEGPNIITVTATATSGAVGTASETVTLDTTPPHVTITSPSNQFITTSPTISVSGNVNDIVVGTVNSEQVTVTVNGLAAQVANRTFLATNVPLSMGSNTITAVATDRAGNSVNTQITVTLQAPSPGQISLLSGNNQSGTIGSALAAPLVVSLTNSAGAPAANTQVIFSVAQNNGMLSVAGGTPAASVLATTNAQGQATANWTLGKHSGAGSDSVQAYSVGFSGTAIFAATANQGTPGIIVIDSGNNQTGAVNQPLPKPLIAVVVDAGSNRLANVPVTFTIKSGGGNIGGQSSITVNTDSDGRADATPTLGFQEGTSNNLITADFPNDTGFPASFTASGLGPGNPANTIITGVVLDNSNNPIPGVTLRAVLTNSATSNSSSVQAAATVQTDAKGQFSIVQAPVGLVYLYVDGSTATVPGTFPTLHYDIVTVAGQNNTVGQPIYLLPIKNDNQLCVTATTGGGTLTIPEAPGFSLTFAPGQVIFPGGSTTGCVSVTTVHPDKVPMVPGFGQQPRFIVTIQPSGAQFNPPAPITLPNVDGLAPRAVTEMYSFDHDINSFVAIGTGTVSDDGQVIRSNSGVGVLKAGWHCGGNPTQGGTAGDCGACATCVGNSCVPTGNGSSCNNACIVGGSGTCNGGSCSGGPAVNCGPATACAGAPTCDPVLGCRPGTPVNCGAGDICTGTPTCDPASGCMPGTPLNCATNNPCVDGSCVVPSGCMQTANQLCQNACNGATSGSCTAGGISGTCDSSGNCNLCGALGAGSSCTCGGGGVGTCGSDGQCSGCPNISVHLTWLNQTDPLSMYIRQGTRPYANSTLVATASPPGGTFTWTPALDGIVSINGSGNQVQVVGQTAGLTDITALYTAPNGQTAMASVFAQVSYPTILVHGIASSAATWATLAATLQQKGLLYDDCFAVASADIDFCAMDFTGAGLPDGNQTDFMTEGQLLGTSITNLLNVTGASKVNLIAHSMGGLVSRAAIERYGHANDVDLFLTVGTPHQGSPLANLLSNPLTKYETLAAIVGLLPPGLNANSSGVKSLRTDSPLLLSLNATAPFELPTSIRYVSVISLAPVNYRTAAGLAYDSLIVPFFCSTDSSGTATDPLDCANVTQNQTLIDNFLPNSDILVDFTSQNLSSVAGVGSLPVAHVQVQGFHTSEPGLIVGLALQYLGWQ
jgi:pimeloyl-ACP methyl ester carboxylesterase